MNHSFLPEAETEYLEAIRFYEEQQAKLGLSLIHEFERIIALVIQRGHSLGSTGSFFWNSPRWIIAFSLRSVLSCDWQ